MGVRVPHEPHKCGWSEVEWPRLLWRMLAAALTDEAHGSSEDP